MGIDAEMFVRTKTKVTEQLLQEWHYKFGCAFHTNLWKFGTESNIVPKELYLFKVDIIEQSGPEDIIPTPDEIFLRLSPMSRYYGPGYERGNIIILMAMAEFLELLIPDSEVWYGGDSSGVLFEKFDSDARKKMMDYFVHYQYEPYQRGFTMYGTAPMCPYCKVATVQFATVQFGSGGNYSSHSCLGCGWKEIMRNGIKKNGWNIKEAFEI